MNKNNATSSITFTTLLTILFIALKLTRVVNWGWLWVLSPIWISLIISIAIIVWIAVKFK